MKLLLVITSYHPRWGGTENQLRRQVRELMRRGHQVTVLTWQHDPAWLRSERIDGAGVIRVPRSSGKLSASLEMAKVLLREAGYADAIAAHQLLYPAYMAGWAALLRRTPLAVKAAAVTATPGSDVAMLTGSRVRRWLALPLLLRATAIAISQELEYDLRRAGFRHVVPIPNGVDDPFPIGRAELRHHLFAPLGIPRSAKVVVAAGRMEWWKGFDVLISAWGSVIERCSGAQLVVIGSGPEERHLRLQIEREGLSGQIHMLPPSYEASSYLSAADVVAIPSFYEGMSNVLLEALASATPVVSTAVSGAVDVIEDGVSGFLVAPRDPASLASGILRALEAGEEVGEHGRRRVLSCCSTEEVVTRYERVLSGGGPAAGKEDARVTTTQTEDPRFAFGENWRHFLSVLDEDRIREAERGLSEMLGPGAIEGKTFLDAGSGSGLMSLAATRLGAARVHSFDFDRASVACTEELKRRYYPDAGRWTVERGDVLDDGYLQSLGQWDIVYSWGVLHHTGDMWTAIDNVTHLVKEGGTLFIAIYNDQGFRSRYWRRVKRFFIGGPVQKAIAMAVHIPYFVLRGLAADIVHRAHPLRRYAEYRQSRGMSVVHDWVDWLGGYPYEVASPDAILSFTRSRGFTPVKLVTRLHGWGCNEYVLRRAP